MMEILNWNITPIAFRSNKPRAKQENQGTVSTRLATQHRIGRLKGLSGVG